MVMNLHRRFLPLLTIFAILVLTPLCAHAAKRIYFAGYAGLTAFPDERFNEEPAGLSGDLGVDEGTDFAGAIGFKLTPQLRVEGEFSYLNSDFNTIYADGFGAFDMNGSLESKMAMLNLYYDFDFNYKKMRPFVGAGIGYAWHDVSIDDVIGLPINTSDSTSGYIWQVGGGVRYPLAKDVSLIAAMRYIDGQDLELDGLTVDYGAKEARIGISWDLPFE